MKLNLRSGLVLLAVAMHLAVPVTAYAKSLSPALQGDFCTTSRSGPATSAPAGGDFPSSFPLPASGEHHCAHAPCCAGGAVDVAAPPRLPIVFRIAFAGVRALEPTPVAAPLAVIMAAHPRGPPHHT
jgi:hypothetical protein